MTNLIEHFAELVLLIRWWRGHVARLPLNIFRAIDGRRNKKENGGSGFLSAIVNARSRLFKKAARKIFSGNANRVPKWERKAKGVSYRKKAIVKTALIRFYCFLIGFEEAVKEVVQGREQATSTWALFLWLFPHQISIKLLIYITPSIVWGSSVNNETSHHSFKPIIPS